MKRIEVRGIIAPDLSSAYTTRRMHTVYLGNGRRIHFTSEREALAFQADTNRFLNELLHELNYLLGQAHMDHRNAWPLLFTDGKPVLSDLESRLRGHLEGADHALDRAVRNTGGPNGMHFAWKHLTDAGTGLARTYALLAELYRYKTQGVPRHQMVIRQRAANDAAERLKVYGRELTTADDGAAR